MLELKLSNSAGLLEDFRRARSQAIRQQIFGLLMQRSTNLWSYETAHQHFGFTGMVDCGFQEIPVRAIVGSVGRSKDFTTGFRPKKVTSTERWIQIKRAFLDMRPLPPIDVYQVGDAYFVVDGNHRVSVSHEMAIEFISAHVTRIETQIPFDRSVLAKGEASLLLRRGADIIDNALHRFGGQLIQWGQRLQSFGDAAGVGASELSSA